MSLNQIWPRNVQDLKYIMHCVSSFFYTEATFGSLEKKDKERLTSTGMKFFGRTAGYTLFDYKRNEKCLEELEVERDDDRLRTFKANWLRYTSITRMTNKILNYRPNGRRRLARLDVRGSVHHSKILTVKTPTRCNSVSKFYYSLFLN